MKVLYVNTYYYGGGAEQVVRQLYHGVKCEDVKTYCMIGRIQKNSPDEVQTIYSGFFDRAYTTIVGGFLNNTLLRTKVARNRIIDCIIREKIDIVHFHNIHSNYFGLEDIEEIQKYCKHIVITLHDMWLLTGGCAHACECKKWISSNCNNCNGNYSMPAFKYSAFVYGKKKKYFMKKNIHYITPSKWLYDQCMQSYLKSEDIQIINNGLDMDRFKVYSKKEARKIFDFPLDKNLLLFVANGLNNPFKGFPYLLDALKLLKDKGKYGLIIIGNKESGALGLEFETFTMGYIDSLEKMNQLYAAADLYIHPSMADVSSFTAMESLASGTPVLAFNTGGIPEVVSEEIGWLVEAGNSQQLAEKIENIFSNREELKKKTKKARIVVENGFNLKDTINRYREVYRDILKEG